MSRVKFEAKRNIERLTKGRRLNIRSKHKYERKGDKYDKSNLDWMASIFIQEKISANHMEHSPSCLEVVQTCEASICEGGGSGQPILPTCGQLPGRNC